MADLVLQLLLLSLQIRILGREPPLDNCVVAPSVDVDAEY